MKKILLPVLIFSLGACSMVPDYLRPSVDTGDVWKESAASSAPISDQWWKDYGSGQLQNLVPQALKANNDLLASLQRIEQARANVTVSTSSLLPQVNASGGADKSWRETAGNVAVSNSHDVGLSIAYEADLFGRARAGREAAKARLEASQFDYEALRIVTASSVVEAYAGALGASERLRVANGNLDIAKDVLKIADARFRAGTTSALELSQQKAAVSNAEAAMASLRAEHSGFINQLAVLVGQAPQNFRIKEEDFKVLVAPRLTPSLPSILLEQRPDIRSAEANLIAANADIGAARAAFFPSLDLAVSGVLSGNPAFSVLTASASALAPIFSGGSLEGALTGSKARKEELVATYRQTVLTAFQEVSDAIAATRAADTRVQSLGTAAAESRNAYKLARARYDSGSIDFQTLLDTQRALLQAEDSATQARLEQIRASLDLIKALGGGWKGQTTL
jgi:outer membrane protein, multidrug efflux system